MLRLLILSVALARATPASSQTIDIAAGQVPSSAALYCEDSTGELQRVTRGDFGAFLEATAHALGTGHRIVPNGKRGNGEDYAVVLFETDPKAPRDRYNAVAYVITAHREGVALRYAVLSEPGKPALRDQGTGMCIKALAMLLDMQPGTRRKDSTTR